MSQAEELLNSLAETAVEHEHAVVDTDTYFSIDPNTRAIKSESRYKNVLMQYDHNSQRYTFELPRYIDGHDMSLCTSAVVNFDNIETKTETETETINSGSYDMLDLRVDPKNPEMVISSWLISRASTQIAGTLSFSIEYKCADSDGNVTYEFGTDVFSDVTIKPRKKNSDAVITEHVDVLEEWRAKIFGAGDSVMANIAAEGETRISSVKAESEIQQAAVELKGAQTLDSIPYDYTKLDTMTDDAVRYKGNAIVCESAGKHITVNDASNDHIRGLKLFGKSIQISTNGYQLFDASALATATHGGVTVTNNTDGSFTVSGNGNLTAGFIAQKDYTHEETLKLLKAGPLNAVVTKTHPYWYVQLRTNDTVYFALTHSKLSQIITDEMLSDPELFMRVGFYADNGATINAGTIKPMLYQDGDGTWEPYTGGKPAPNLDYPQEIVSVENPTVSVCGKNLIPFPYGESTTTKNGVTFTVNDDCSIRLKGTATKVAVFSIFKGTMPLNGKFTLSGVYNTTNPSTHYMQPYVDGIFKDAQINGSRTYDINGNLTEISLYVKSGETVDCVIYPQLEIGDQMTEYESPTTQFIASQRTILGIPVTTGGNYTDADGQQWICDEIDLERGVYVQRIIEFVADDTLAYEKSTKTNPNGNVYFTLINKNHNVLLSNDYTSLCDNRTIRKELEELEINDTRIAVNSVGSHMCIWFCSDAITVDEMKKSMGDCKSKFLLPIITPIETPLTAEEITAFKALHTNCPNTTILNDAGAWMSVKYNADTKTYVESPKTLKLVDSSTGVVYELKVIDGALSVIPV